MDDLKDSKVAVACLSFVILARGTGGLQQQLLAAPTVDLVTLAADGVTVMMAFGVILRRFSLIEGSQAPARFGFLFLFLLALGMLNPYVLGTRLSILGFRAMAMPILSFFVFRHIRLSRNGARVTFSVLVVVVLFNLIAALRQAFVGLTGSELAMLRSNGSTYLVGDAVRLPGLFASGQELGFAAAGFFVWFGLLWISGRSAMRAWSAVIAITSLVVAALALQRGPLIAAVLAIFVILMLRRQSTADLGKVIVAASVAALAAVAGQSILSAFDQQRSASLMSAFGALLDLGGDDSYRTRQAQTLPIAMRLVSESPLIGFGTGASGPAASALPQQSPLAAYPLGGITADNGYLLVTLQVGLLGLVSFLLLLSSWLIRGGMYGQSTFPLPTRGVLCFVALAMVFGGYWPLTGPMALLMFLVATSERGIFLYSHDRARRVDAE